MLGSQEPRVRVRPAADGTLGDLACDLAADYGLTADPWQRLTIEDWLATDRAGHLAALTAGQAVPRQNGKNAELEVAELFKAVGQGRKVLHTAHEVKTAQKHFKRLMHFFGQQRNDPGARFPELNERVTEIRRVNGQEAVFLDNGGSIEIIARSKNSGRGFTVDDLVLDEAQELNDDALEALMPTTSAAPSGDPQWIYTGTPPGPSASGEVFSRVRAAALGESPHRMAWTEWSVVAEQVDEIDRDDRTLWYANNPALGRRLQLEVVLGERENMSAEGFARERLGWWRPVEAGRAAIDYAAWLDLSDAGYTDREFPTFAVATSPDRDWSAIGVAWKRADGATQVMLADYRPDTTWIPDRIAELRARWSGRVLVDQASRGLVPDADEVSQADRARADNILYDAVVGGAIRHGNEPALNTAVRGARWRRMGETRVLDRKGDLDISPLVAAALAAWGATSAPNYNLLDSVR